MANFKNEAVIKHAESEKKERWTTIAKWTYWILTLSFTTTMFIAGIMLLAGVDSNVDGITHLGYPAYICKILGVAKVLGSVAIVYGRFPILKEWAYAGYSFNLIGAAASYAFYGDSFGKMLVPIIILIAVLASYRQWKKGWM
ncbi:DoxX family protein [Parapedobacter lycopersici]|uniref:DoxX family protein n=1 Tax=Parapedobacter lycopersici TaxID=1864939 RepID=UPI00214D48BA|nr:DoxX family protein [Parapedobacter lycopersici]